MPSSWVKTPGTPSATTPIAEIASFRHDFVATPGQRPDDHFPIDALGAVVRQSVPVDARPLLARRRPAAGRAQP
jgi:hypothetical protein